MSVTSESDRIRWLLKTRRRLSLPECRSMGIDWTLVRQVVRRLRAAGVRIIATTENAQTVYHWDEPPRPGR
jgi:hypothetical protein